jgi:hypothetical protein
LDGYLAQERAATSTRDRTAADLAATRTQLASTTDEAAALNELAARRRAEVDRLVPVAARLRSDLRAITTEGYVTGFGVNDALDPTLTSAERARRAGGECRVVSKRGGGTKVFCKLPIVAPRGGTTGSTVA